MSLTSPPGVGIGFRALGTGEGPEGEEKASVAFGGDDCGGSTLRVEGTAGGGGLETAGGGGDSVVGEGTRAEGDSVVGFGL